MSNRVIRLLAMVVISFVVTVAFTFADVPYDNTGDGDTPSVDVQYEGADDVDADVDAPPADVQEENTEDDVIPPADVQKEKKDSGEAAAGGKEHNLKEITLTQEQKDSLAKAKEAAKKSMSAKGFWDEYGCFYVYAPSDGKVVYYDNNYVENLWVKVEVRDYYDDYYTIPVFEICESGDDDFTTLCYYEGDSPVTPYSYDIYKGYFEVPQDAGTYDLWIYALPCDEYGNLAEDWVLMDYPLEFVTFKVAQLKAPTKVKAKAGKKKVTVSFKKASGANKTIVYRSTKKKSGYKKIGTTTGSKYVDKKAKKGKKYYYKLRTYRTTGLYSKYTSPVRSGKVKR